MTFNWMNFDTAFLLDIIQASDLPERTKILVKESSDDKAYVINKFLQVCNAPNRDFVMKYRPIIEQQVLKHHRSEVTKICKALNIQGTTHNERQIKMSKKATSKSLIDAYIKALYSISGKEVELNEFSKFKSTIAINMKETAVEDVPLYDFQKEVYESVKKHYLVDNKGKGMLVMPTGSGKTRTATYFLIKEMVSRGYQILWIAHRHMLIDQAADSFYRFAGLAKIENPNIKDYTISCISGEHMSIRQVDKSDVIVASIGSICRSKDHLRRILKNKVMIVVDEAHHAYAPTYRETINFVKKSRKDTKILGLTATPVRANERDSRQLLQSFDNNIICNVAMADLIAKGILSEPKFEHVKTGMNFEPIITLDEEKLIRKYGELPESLITKIAKSNSRNKVILDQYLNNKERYGKTLIFALNVLHCRFLHEELTKAGVKAGLVYSGKEDNTKVINMFKDNKLDVLVNVNIMTEGTDVPDVQTVFLTRPTSSEGLLMQMIGRGMRGLQAQGTETVNIVDFNDSWSVFNKWLNPEWLILEEKEEIEKIPVQERRKIDYKEYEWSFCQEVYKSLIFKMAKADTVISLPAGWYTLVDEEGELHRMLVFENQLKAFKEMMKDKPIWKDDLTITPEEIINKYFKGFSVVPSERDIALLMDNTRTMELAPGIHVFVNRKKYDPYYVVLEAEKSGENLMELGPKLYDDNPIIQDLYRNKEEYTMELCRAQIYKGKKPIIGVEVEELPEELIPFDRTPYHNLPELVDKVKQEMFGGVFDGIKSIEWTDKPYSTYYGIHHEAADGVRTIKINSILNSESVPEEVVKYVIYHELLHRDNMSHDKAFKAKEHEYPDYEKWENFLYGHMPKFNILEW